MSIDRAVLFFAGVVVLVSALLTWLVSSWWLLLTALAGLAWGEADVSLDLRKMLARLADDQVPVVAELEDGAGEFDRVAHGGGGTGPDAKVA